MKPRFEFLAFILFTSSLIVLTFSHHERMFAIAFSISLISLALWLADDWLDVLFIRIADIWFLLSSHRFVATSTSTCTKTGQGFLLKRTCHPLRAHQRWLKARAGRGIRYLVRHRGAF